jgi:hypothetical protein
MKMQQIRKFFQITINRKKTNQNKYTSITKLRKNTIIKHKVKQSAKTGKNVAKKLFYIKIKN